ncbi:MAG: DNA-3-methyladenine glycosylase 2 family protein [Patescibacteria group bacterium]
MPLDTKAALKHFKQHDPVMAHLLETSLKGTEPLTLPTPKRKTEYFGSIVTSIISQQISTAAARSIKARVIVLLGKLTPETVLAADFLELKNCGLSAKKTQYLKHNAKVWPEIPYKNFTLMSDDQIIAELTKLYGIGRWTAEMFLMFSLARPDVFSYGDLGLMQSLYSNYNYQPRFKRKIENTINSWSPHKTVASLALWHTRDN